MSPNELREVAKNIIANLYGLPQSEIRENKELESIKKTVSDLNLNNEINLFPSIEKGACSLNAIFLSIKHQPRLKKLPRNEMIPLKIVLEKISQHIFGECKGFTKQIILITDTIDTDTFKPWISSFKNSNCWIEVVYVQENGNFEVVNNILGLF